MNKFIFLDIDGVLASYEYLMKGRGYMDPEKCKLINELIDDTNAKVVISSSWGYNEDTINHLKNVGFNIENVIGGTEHLEIGCDYLCRGNSIAKWLYRNVPDNTDFEYVIIDDDCDFLMSQQENFVWVNRETGITNEDIKMCKDILERKIDSKVYLTFMKNKYELWK